MVEQIAYAEQRRKQKMNEIMSSALILAENAPLTGDNFPKGILIGVLLLAVAAAVIAGVASNKKK